MDLRMIKVMNRLLDGADKECLNRLLDIVKNLAQSNLRQENMVMLNENSWIEEKQIYINEFEIKNIYVSLNEEKRYKKYVYSRERPSIQLIKFTIPISMY